MYDKFYKEFENELHKTISSFLLWKCMHDRPAQDKAVLNALNKTPTSWLTIRHSLHVTFFITLGRIFDKRKDAFSVIKLLKYCENNISLFSKEKLRERRMKDLKEKPDWLDDYINNAYEATQDDIQSLMKETEKYRNLFNDVYQPIRHKLIAHKSQSHIGNSDELYEKTRIGDIDKILEFLNSIKEVLFDLYINGRKPGLTNYKLNREFYESDFNNLIDLVKNA